MTNNNTRKRRTFSTKQSVEVKFSDRGFAFAKMGNSDYVGIVPFYDASTRPKLAEVPQGVIIYNSDTGQLELSDPDNNLWIPLAGGGPSGSGSIVGTADVHDTVRYDGSNYVPTAALSNDGTNITIPNRLTVSGSLVVPSGNSPVNSASSGTVGELRWANNFFYVYTADGWRRVNLQYF